MEFTQIGVLKGHGGRVTAIATPAENASMIVSASRDKTLIKWDVSAEMRGNGLAGRPVKSLIGHSDFVEDVQISSDGAYALSGAWDNTLALWDLSTGTRRNVFKGHKNDVLSVAFSPDNRQIVSGSRDRSVKVWNTIAQVKVTFDEANGYKEAHTDWVTCVRFAPASQDANPFVVSGSADGTVKVWRLGEWGLRHTFKTDKGCVNAVCISPDGSLCASGGKYGVASLFDINEMRPLYDLGTAGEPITALTFSPIRYWLSVAAGNKITVFNLENHEIVTELIPLLEDGVPAKTEATCLAWSADGNILYAGFDDGVIRVWQVSAVHQE
jgi:guanine nucleotide-binding protein subunit beta-2-like 1 protein